MSIALETLSEFSRLVDQIAIEAIPDVLGHLASLDARLRVRLLRSSLDRCDHLKLAPVDSDRLLSVKEAAEILGHSPTWVYRNRAHLPAVNLPGGSIRFSVLGLHEFIRRRSSL